MLLISKVLKVLSLKVAIIVVISRQKVSGRLTLLNKCE